MSMHRLKDIRERWFTLQNSHQAVDVSNSTLY